jgi:hypothetical protein
MAKVWSISQAIGASELIFGLQIGAFYSIVGLQVNKLTTAALADFSLLLIT